MFLRSHATMAFICSSYNISSGIMGAKIAYRFPAGFFFPTFCFIMPVVDLFLNFYP